MLTANLTELARIVGGDHEDVADDSLRHALDVARRSGVVVAAQVPRILAEIECVDRGRRESATIVVCTRTCFLPSRVGSHRCGCPST